MTSRITDFDAPWRFVDEMVRGPFARFRHEHIAIHCAQIAGSRGLKANASTSSVREDPSP